jgi:uncharacterized XkdX family phage protein
MSNFEKAQSYYDKGLWNKAMLKNLVKKGFITKNQYEEITGEVYK